MSSRQSSRTTQVEAHFTGPIVNSFVIVAGRDVMMTSSGATPGGTAVNLAGQGAAMLSQLQSEFAAAPPARVLPPPYRQDLFVNRQRDLSRLTSNLQPRRQATLTGVEGVGRLTLTTAWLDSYPRIARNFPDGIVYLNYPLDQGAITETLYVALGGRLDFVIPNAILRSWVSRKRFLLIVEDVDEATEADFRLWKAYTASGGLLLIAHQSQLGASLAISPLEREAGGELVRRVAGQGWANERLCREVSAQLDDLPWAIVTLVRRAVDEGLSAQDLLDLIKKAGGQAESAKRALAVLQELLSAEEWQLLWTLSAFRSPTTSEEALAETSGIAQPAVILADALVAGRVVRGSPRFGLERTLKRLLQRHAVYELLQERIAEHYLRRLQGAPEIVQNLDADRASIEGAMDWCMAHRRHEDTVSLAQGVLPHLHARGRWEAWHSRAQQALQAAEALGNQRSMAWAQHELGTSFLLQGDLLNARFYLQRALQVRRAIGDQTGAEITQHNLGILDALAAPPRGGRGEQGPTTETRGGRWPLGRLLLLTMITVAAVWIAVNKGGDIIPIRRPTGTPTPYIVARDTPTATAIRRVWTPTPTEAPMPREFVLCAAADTYISEARPYDHFGDQEFLVVGYVLEVRPELEARRIGRGTFDVLIRFNFGDVPPGRRIAEAVLEVFLEHGFQGEAARMDVYEVGPDWSEDRASWKDAPPRPEAPLAAREIGPEPGWYGLEITEVARMWQRRGEMDNSLRLHIEKEYQAVRIFYSREAGGERCPRLRLFLE